MVHYTYSTNIFMACGYSTLHCTTFFKRVAIVHYTVLHSTPYSWCKAIVHYTAQYYHINGAWPRYILVSRSGVCGQPTFCLCFHYLLYILYKYGQGTFIYCTRRFVMQYKYRIKYLYFTTVLYKRQAVFCYNPLLVRQHKCLRSATYFQEIEP